MYIHAVKSTYKSTSVEDVDKGKELANHAPALRVSTAQVPGTTHDALLIQQYGYLVPKLVCSRDSLAAGLACSWPYRYICWSFFIILWVTCATNCQ
jgi:hypothetical protein